jgi:serine/threonine-protein kinase HipA
VVDPVTAVDELKVYRGTTFVGTLTRTERGCRFRYDDEYRNSSNPRPVAYRMPLSEHEYSIEGVNLLPFFANLLPEGLRLDALRSRVKTSRDDRFSLLAMVGSESIGDVWTAPNGGPKRAQRRTVEEVDFRSLWQEELSTSTATIAGVQPKISGRRLALPEMVLHGREVILKLNESEEKYPRLLQNEHFFMGLAQKCGLQVSASQLVVDTYGTEGLAVHRFDRGPGRKSTQRWHVEDGCQLLDYYPDAKYRPSWIELGRAFHTSVSAPIPEILRLIELISFSYLVANGDLHAKNVSVIESESGLIRLSPAYDLVSTWLYGDHTMALSLEGKQSGWRRRDFLRYGERFEVPARAIHHSLDRITGVVEANLGELPVIGFPASATNRLRNVIQERVKELA